MAEVSDRLFLGRIVPGMDVCDVTGEKVGSIAHIYRFDEATEEGGTARSGDELIEVKSGFLGLGKHYYVPFSAIQDVTTGCVFVNQPKDRIDDMGWDVRPDYLESLSS